MKWILIVTFASPPICQMAYMNLITNYYCKALKSICMINQFSLKNIKRRYLRESRQKTVSKVQFEIFIKTRHNIEWKVAVEQSIQLIYRHKRESIQLNQSRYKSTENIKSLPINPIWQNEFRLSKKDHPSSPRWVKNLQLVRTGIKTFQIRRNI